MPQVSFQAKKERKTAVTVFAVWNFAGRITSVDYINIDQGVRWDKSNYEQVNEQKDEMSSNTQVRHVIIPSDRLSLLNYSELKPIGLLYLDFFVFKLILPEFR